MEIFYGKVRIIENAQATPEVCSLKLDAPEIAKRARPGQFVMLRIPGHKDPLLGRAFAVFKTYGDVIQVLYAVVGKATRIFQELRVTAELEVWGPLGNGFPDVQTGHLVMIAGGIGYSPLRSVSEWYMHGHPGTEKVTFLMGARTAEMLDTGNLPHVCATETFFATDDGTRGHRGFVTELLGPTLENAKKNGESPVVMACGPTVMMREAAKIAAAAGVKCYVSLETPMACGMGICFTCVTKKRDENAPDGWDYCRTCVDGPVFEAGELIF